MGSEMCIRDSTDCDGREVSDDAEVVSDGGSGGGGDRVGIGAVRISGFAEEITGSGSEGSVGVDAAGTGIVEFDVVPFVEIEASVDSLVLSDGAFADDSTVS